MKKQVEISRDSKNIPTIIEYDVEYSFKNYSQSLELLDIPIKELEGKVIYASDFSSSIPDTIRFPNVSKLTFVKCNLNNCRINPGWTLIQCSNKKIALQNDLRYWELDDQNKPVKVTCKEEWQDNGYSVSPGDIPATKLTSITQIKRG